ncbi:MAG TPA: fumarylacetoacetate hydrolase family protein [Bryobacteraceae bacterium]|nr:fumarylacetoacetate hydrolase family protein [Bryobacteraceae bacterium]
MLIFRTEIGWELEGVHGGRIPIPPQVSGRLTTREDLYEYLAGLAGEAAPNSGKHALIAPLEEQEVWAAGVTYFRSRTARMAESEAAGGMSFYDRVYTAARPELFFKSTPHRTVGPGAPVRIRHDSKWNVPEPELTLLVSPKAKILGYTVGNDMSSRDIEGENPLYLPQAKVYDGSCALGPGILVTPAPLPRSTAIRIEIRRAGSVAFSDSTTLESMKRDPAELVDYLFRENTFPNGCFLLTGTGIVPPHEFTLASGDEISITIDGIGALTNPVA